MPNRLSRYFHNLPRPALLCSTACNHVIELFAPWLLLLPWGPSQAAFGVLHIVFQLALILTGNLSFLNWLTIVPALWCFDDATLVGLLPPQLAANVGLQLASAKSVELGAGVAASSCILAR